MSRSETLNLAPLVANLDTAGLNLWQAFSVDYLADSMPELILPVGSRYLVLIGNYGNALWAAMPAEYLSRQHPVDTYTTDSISSLLDGTVSNDSWSFIYPHTPDGVSLSLQQLGGLAGWHHASPLGIGINQRFGLWFAYRAVFVLRVEIDKTTIGLIDKPQVTGDSPCISCEHKECVAACPADAVTFGLPPNLNACATHRLEVGSGCAQNCFARLACPIATQYRYHEDLLAYHYDRSLSSLKRWVQSDRKKG